MKNYHFLRNIFFFKKKKKTRIIFFILWMEVNICNKMIDARMMSASAFCFLKIFSGGIWVESLICRIQQAGMTVAHGSWSGQLCWRARVRIPLKFLCQLKVWKYWIRGVDGPRSTNCTNNIKFYSARIICISKTVSVTDHHSLLGKISKWSIQPISDFKMSIGRKLSKRRFDLKGNEN